MNIDDVTDADSAIAYLEQMDNPTLTEIKDVLSRVPVTQIGGAEPGITYLYSGSGDPGLNEAVVSAIGCSLPRSTPPITAIARAASITMMAERKTLRAESSVTASV